MKIKHVLLCIGLTLAGAAGAPGGDDWVTVKPEEFEGAINNPLKGFRDFHSDGYGLLHRQYIGWNDIELNAEDTVERIIARTNDITRLGGKSFNGVNMPLSPEWREHEIEFDVQVAFAKEPRLPSSPAGCQRRVPPDRPPSPEDRLRV